MSLIRYQGVMTKKYSKRVTKELEEKKETDKQKRLSIEYKKRTGLEPPREELFECPLCGLITDDVIFIMCVDCHIVHQPPTYTIS